MSAAGAQGMNALEDPLAHPARKMLGDRKQPGGSARGDDGVFGARGPQRPAHKCLIARAPGRLNRGELDEAVAVNQAIFEDRKSTRLNSSHVRISYAVF